MHRQESGLTLIELMITVAIIAILAVIALPAYNNYRAHSANNACLTEAKAYMNTWLSAVRSEGFDEDDLPAYTPEACESGPALNPAAASGPPADDAQFTPRSPGDATIQCQTATATCRIPE